MLVMRRLIAIALTGVIVLTAFGADYAQVGSLTKNSKWEIGVLFDSTVTRDSALLFENYLFTDPQVEILELEYVALNHSVILTATGLIENSVNSLMLTNMQSSDGSALPAATHSFRAKPISWVSVGGQEFGFEPEAVAVGDDGFDLISGGVQMWDRYDESTFVYETVTGDFDRRVRVVSQEPSSEFARAGLMVREALDAGKQRPADVANPAQAFSRYVQVHVTPDDTAFVNDNPITNIHQVIARPYLGGIGSPNFEATEILISNEVSPPYPNAWLRLARIGQTFYFFRSPDGTNWTSLGSFSFPTPFSNTAYVGPNYSPETGNIPQSSGARRAFLARFREYGPASGDIPTVNPPRLGIVRTEREITIDWNGGGTLQTSSDLTTWSNLPGSSPVKITADMHHQFFRVRIP
jgi:hypothetical protein